MTPSAGSATTGTPDLDPAEATVVAALGLEAWAVRRRAPGIRLVAGGVGLEALQTPVDTPVALSIGLAGGLSPDHPPGTVIVPGSVSSAYGVSIADGVAGAGAASGAAGSSRATDPRWTAALRAASRRLGFNTVEGPLVSTGEVVTGDGRATWAALGYVAADMESAAIASLAPRMAAVRVLLDTPTQEMSSAWRRPARAALNPIVWAQGAWLMRAAPRYALRAAAVLGEALRRDVHAKV